MKKKLVELTCLKLDSQGKGIVQYQNKTFALANLLPQEKVCLDISHPDKPVITQYLTQSPDRVKPRCDQFPLCGGCQLLHMNDAQQQIFKTTRVKETFKPLQSMMDCQIPDCIMAEDPWYYRNKVQLPVTTSRHNQTVIGFYQENSLEIIEKDDCFIQTRLAKDVLKTIRALIQTYHVTPYDWQRRRGTLKYLLFRYGFYSQELMVVFVTNGPDFKYRKAFVSRLTAEFPQIKTIVQNINLRKDHLVLDRQEKVWYGKGYILDSIGDVKFLISSKSFYQINPPQVKKLYDCVKAFANLSGQETIIDAYCGVGTIGLYLAKQAKQVYGIELIVSAIDDARKNARLNHISNASFQVGDASQYMEKLARAGKKVDIVIVDPPRSGCTPQLIKAVEKLQPEKFIYVSCQIETQARDLALLKQSGYRIQALQAFDLFPQTYHVETVVLMSRAR